MENIDSRDKIEKKYKWQLEDIFPSNKAWEEEYKRLGKLMSDIPNIKATLCKSAKSLLKSLKQMEEMEHLSARLYIYARMRRDEDNTNTKYQAMASKAQEANVKLSAALSFVNPQLLALPKGVLDAYIKDGKKAAKDKKTLSELNNYTFMLKELLRTKKHVLSAKEEKLLSMTGDISGTAKDIFTMLNNADLKFASIKGEDGEDAELTHGSYIVLMQSKDREVRKRAFSSMYESYKANINTIGTAYAASVKKDIFYSKARNFDSAIARPLFADNVPISLYDNLIKTVHDNLDSMHRYVDLKKKLLGLEEMHMYDIYAPLVADVETNYSYEDSMTMVKQGLAVLGADYAKLLDRSQKERWIDVYETPGKTSGAYSWGVYGTHPYVLLNHRGDLDSVFTIAHELGHALHSYHSNNAQPMAKADYTIFVAEVASTVNEILLTRYLLDTVKDKNQRLYVLNHYLDQFRTTVIRQTMFAEFEKIAHHHAENDDPLTHASLCEIYGKLNAKYHGKSMAQDELISYEWARIPHFYNAFYVYKYATGLSCAVQIASDIYSGKKNAVKNYIKFLSSGGSNHPLNLLKIAGVELESGEPVDVCMKEFKRALGEFEAAF